ASKVADAEILAIYGEAMEKLDFTNYKLLINDRKLITGMARAVGVPQDQAVKVFRSLDKLNKIGREGVKEELVRNGTSEAAANKALDLFMTSGEVRTFSDNAAVLPELAEPRK